MRFGRRSAGHYARPAYGHQLRQARRKRQLTQVALARALGVSQSYVAQMEAGRTYPSLALASRIAELFRLGPPSEDEVRITLGEVTLAGEQAHIPGRAHRDSVRVQEGG